MKSGTSHREEEMRSTASADLKWEVAFKCVVSGRRTDRRLKESIFNLSLWERDWQNLSHALQVCGHSRRSSWSLHMLHCSSPICKNLILQVFKHTSHQSRNHSKWPLLNQTQDLHALLVTSEKDHALSDHKASTKIAAISQSVCLEWFTKAKCSKSVRQWLPLWSGRADQDEFLWHWSVLPGHWSNLFDSRYRWRGRNALHSQCWPQVGGGSEQPTPHCRQKEACCLCALPCLDSWEVGDTYLSSLDCSVETGKVAKRALQWTS